MRRPVLAVLFAVVTPEVAYGREEPQVFGVWIGVRKVRVSEEPYANTHGRETVPVSDVRHAVLAVATSEESRADAQRREAVRV